MAVSRTITATPRTGLRCVPGIDVDHRNSTLQGLVLDKLLKLPERPRVEISALFFPWLHPFSDVGQVFQHEGIAGFQGVDNAAANHMIDRLHLPAFLPPKPFHETPTAPCAFGKELPAQVSVVATNLMGLMTRMLLAVTRCGQVVHAHIHADGSVPFGRFGRIHISLNDDVKIVSIRLFPVGDFGSPVHFPGVEDGSLPVTHLHMDADALLDRRDRSPAVLQDAKRAGIQPDGRISAEFPLSLGLGRLAGFGHLVSGGTGQVGGKRKLLTHVVVGQVMQGDLIPASVFMGHVRDIIGDLTHQVHGVIQGAFFLGSGVKFHFESLGHFGHSAIIIAHGGGWEASPNGLGGSPPRTQVRGFRHANFMT